MRTRDLIQHTTAVLSMSAIIAIGSPLRAQEIALQFAPDATRVNFTLHTTLHTVHGAFRLRSGSMQFDVATGAASGQLVVDAGSGDSGNRSRDERMHSAVLESSSYPEIVFTPASIEGRVNPLGDSQVQIRGAIVIHGKSHELALQARVHCSRQEVTATARFNEPAADSWGGSGGQSAERDRTGDVKAKLPAAARDCLQSWAQIYDLLEEERTSSESSLQAYAANFPEIARLRSLPGIGHLLGALIWSEIGDLKRFASADALVNDTGLVPSLYASGEVTQRGSITRQGPVWLRWALVAAAHGAVRGQNPMAQRYRSLRRRKVVLVAKVAIARTLARCLYGVLKHGQDFQVERWGRRIGNELEQQA
jgi:polyisoprenoid-binding protein YceI